MITRNKKRTAAEVAAQDEDQAVTVAAAAETGTDVPDSPPGDLDSPAEYTARAEQMAGEAAAGQAFAEERRSQAQALITAARAEAAAIIAEAEARARELGKEADRREHEISGLVERASWLRNAAAAQEKAIAAAVQAAGLAEDRERLTAELSELDDTLADLRTRKQDTETKLADARSSADVERAEGQETRLKALEGVITGQTATRNAAQNLFTAIGDGNPDFPGQLADALKAVQAHQLEVHRILNATFPGRPEARLDVAVAELKAALEGNLARIAEEARPKPAPPRTIVHLNR